MMRKVKRTRFDVTLRHQFVASGFTLIELLVVIAIIALLLSIVVPSLRRARDLGRRITCASNMRSIGMGIHLYAEGNDGYIPPLNLIPEYGSGGRGTQRTNHWARWFRRADMAQAWGPWWNLGFLWAGSYIDTGETFYCTSPFAAYDYREYAEPAFPTDRGIEGGVRGVRVSYFYNPTTVSHVDRNRRYTRALEINANRLMMADFLHPESYSHYGPGWNRLWGDGSVDFVVNPYVMELMQKDPTGFDGGNYVLFDMVLNALVRNER